MSMNPKDWMRTVRGFVAEAEDEDIFLGPYWTKLKGEHNRLDQVGVTVVIGSEEVHIPLPVLEQVLDRVYAQIARQARDLVDVPLADENARATEARTELKRSMHIALSLSAQPGPSRAGSRVPRLRPVIIESPYRDADPGRKAAHGRYLHDAILNCLERGEAPYASHSYLPQHLDDDVDHERLLGIGAGLSIAEALNAKHVVYLDRGITEGMSIAIEHARAAGRVIEYRSLWWWSQ